MMVWAERAVFAGLILEKSHWPQPIRGIALYA